MAYLKDNHRVISQERILILFFLLIGVFGFIGSLSFNEAPSRLPGIASILMILASILILLKKIIGRPSEERDDSKSSNTSQEEKDISQRSKRQGVLTTIIAILVFIILSYLIGFLFASPIFAFMYLVLYGKPWYHGIVLGILSFLLVGIFTVITNVPLQTGVLINVT